jgi:hypothetical protein
MAAKKKRAKKTKAVRRARKTTRATTKRNLTKRRSAKKAIKKKIKKKSASRQRAASTRSRGATRTVRSGEQAGDLQGISKKARADSESVNELLEEGNAFEAGVVSGVQDAGNNQGQEVQTHEVPEDDVPGEYLDEQ